MWKKFLIIPLALVAIAVGGLICVILDKKTDKYTVTFDTAGGSEVVSQIVKMGNAVIKPTDPTRNGYIFNTWTLDGVMYNFNMEVTKNITLVANWIEKSKKTYTVTFDTNDGAEILSSQIVQEGNKVIKPIDPIREGYVFAGWMLDDMEYDFEQPITKDLILVANWEEVKTYTVVFDTDGGSEISKQTVQEGEKATKPVDPTKEGYTFNSWKLDGKDYDFDSLVTKDITLVANWKEAKTYTVTFDTDGGSEISKQTVQEGGKVTKPTNTTKEGYTFNEWTLNGDSYDFNTEVEENITLKATWKAVYSYWNSFYNEAEYARGSLPVTTYSDKLNIPNISNYGSYVRTSSSGDHAVCLLYNSKEFCAKSSYNISSGVTASNELKNHIESSLGASGVTCEYNSEVVQCRFGNYTCMLFLDDGGISCSNVYEGYDYSCTVSGGTAMCSKHTASD